MHGLEKSVHVDFDFNNLFQNDRCALIYQAAALSKAEISSHYLYHKMTSMALIQMAILVGSKSALN